MVVAVAGLPCLEEGAVDRAVEDVEAALRARHRPGAVAPAVVAPISRTRSVRRRDVGIRLGSEERIVKRKGALSREAHDISSRHQFNLLLHSLFDFASELQPACL